MYNATNDTASVNHDAVLRALIAQAVKQAAQSFEAALQTAALRAMDLDPNNGGRAISDAELETLSVLPGTLKDFSPAQCEVLLLAAREASDRACLAMSEAYRARASKLAKPKAVRPSPAVMRVARALKRDASRAA